MCGIAGIISDRDPQQQQVLAAHMVKLMAHRGPDDEGIWQGDGLCLGHRRLSILDLSPSGRQPFSYMNGRYVIVFNGEIYNYIELRDELGCMGYTFRTNTDTEVIPAAYDRFGIECVKRFNGMWAFALWDREERILFASRDRFGKKPFYYSADSGCFIFASEIKAVIAGSGIDSQPNVDRIYDFALARRLDHTSETMFRGVYQLPPAHNLIMKNRGFKINQYWSLRPTRERGIDDNLIEELRGLFCDAVRIRLRSDVPVGSALSGGLDSSAVTCTAASLYNPPDGGMLTTFTSRVRTASTEAGVLQFIHDQYKLRKVESWPDARMFWDDIDDVIWHQEEPFGDGSMVSHFDIMRQARLAGVPVVLGGQGGDEIFVGYTSQVWALLGEYLRYMRLISLCHLLCRYPRGQGLAVYQGLAHAIFHAIPSSVRDRLVAELSRRHVEWLDRRIWRGRSRRAAEIYKKLPYFDNYLLNVIQRWSLPGFLHYEDRNSMAFGVETRSPFLDYRLAELLFSMRPETKVKGAETKYSLRLALSKIVPEAVLTRRRKEAFPSPLADWLRENKNNIFSVLLDPETRRIPFVEPRNLETVARRFFDNSSEPVDGIWRALCVCLWYHRLISRSSEYRHVKQDTALPVCIETRKDDCHEE